MSQISAIEQEMLEYINRARANPEGEFNLVIADSDSVTGTSANITNAMRYFGVDPEAYRTAMSMFSSVAPLAWSDELSTAAEGHSAALLAADAQSHQLPGGPNLRTRVEDAGYTNWTALGENVYSYADSVFHGHAGFMVDWGFDSEDSVDGQLVSDWQTRGDGMQDPAGHRNSIMSSNYTEIGIGIIEDTNTTNSVGPYIITQDFGRRSDGDAKLLGVVIDDQDGDRFYDVGEGLGGISVIISQGGAVVGTTTTWEAGGYQISLAPGTYDVKFSGAGIDGSITRTVVMGSQNLKLDGFAADAQPIGTSGNDVLNGSSGNEQIDGLAGSDWISPSGGNDTVDGGEGIDTVSFANVRDATGRTSGQYRLDIDLAVGSAESHDGSEQIVLRNIENVTGSGFADQIKGDEGSNVLRGLGDYDWFIATEGNDTIDGGNGRDMVSFLEHVASFSGGGVSDVFGNDGRPPSAEQANGVVVDLSNGANNSGLAVGQNFISVERITGSVHQDVFYGDEGQNDLRGLGGYDWFVSSSGGRERYYGGNGLDTVTYFNAGSGVEANLSNGARVDGRETGYGSRGDAARDLFFEIENLVGSRFGDKLVGSSGRNQLNGLEGDDLLFGLAGNDYFMGGAGDDMIDGGAGSDYALFSGNRADYTLQRGTGSSSNQITVAGVDGSDLLVDVEYLRFDDGDVTIWSL